MWSVMVVEDEYYARRGMERLVELIGGEYELIGAAENGAAALEMIRELHPSIVLTDIRMPEMDGLELIRASEGSGSRFIIITGHNDVEYAKQALRYHTVDYLLKPVDQKELKKVLDQAVELLSQDINALRHRIVAYLRGQTADTSVIGRIPAREYQLVLFELEAAGAGAVIRQGAQVLRDRLLEWCEIPWVVVQMHTDRVVVLSDAAEDWLPRVNLLQTTLKELEIVVSTAIVGAKEIGGLPDAYEAAKRMLQGRFYQGAGHIFTKLPTPRRRAREGELNQAVQAVFRSVNACNTREALRGLEVLFQILWDTQPGKDRIAEICMSFYLQITANLREAWILPAGFAAYNPARHDSSLNSLRVNTEAMIRQGLDLLREKQCDQEDNPVEKAIQIIGTHYCEDLVLEQIAQEVFLNPSYLSRKLKETLGMNFSKYITSLRIEKAQELLQRGASVEQAAKEVGYPNYRYFSKVFKENVGCLPSHYLRS
ncbi:MAG: response regulator transcription factor [Lachnospiraceae bacterium]